MDGAAATADRRCDRQGYDVLVIGSGFGGSVAALRLSEKGYRVGVLEAGRRFADVDLPSSSWDLRNFLWAPRLGLRGIQRISLLRDVLVLSGAGVGGGSLVYANALYEPLDAFYADPQWAHITDWRAELAPFYDQASRMLGVSEDTQASPSDVVMRRVADDMGVGDTFHHARVGVYLGEPGTTVDDPYFGGVGPPRSGCLRCGECMTGCRHGAKNVLTSNYLWLAERSGAGIHPLTTVTALRPLAGGGYAVDTEGTGIWGRSGRCTFHAGQVVLAAGTLGTQQLLHRMRDTAWLPYVSPRLGELTRTNSEAIVGAPSRRRDADFTRGPAITSSFYPDTYTHIQPVRYGHGSSLMGLLATILVDGGGRVPRWARFLWQAARHPLTFARSLSLRRWPERTLIVLAMQSLDNSMRTYRKRGLFRTGLTSAPGHGEPNPRWIPVAHEVARRVADRIGGDPGGTWSDVANIPMTAHIIGGCPIGDAPETGVIDPYHRVYGHDALHVVDGAAVAANPGVNPALTITAQAERAIAFWPNRGERDPRPQPGAAYQRVDPVTPRYPAVPASAPAALRPARRDPRYG